MKTVKLQTIPGFPTYAITTDGRAKNVKTGKWLRPFLISGRKTYGLYVKGDGRRARYRSAARLVLETFVGPCPPGMECCHKNDDRQDDWLENLYWGTHRENILDAVKNDKRGSALNVMQVRVIHHLLNSGELTYAAISRIFGLSVYNGLVSNIARGKTWASVTGRGF